MLQCNTDVNLILVNHTLSRFGAVGEPLLETLPQRKNR